ncbi:TPA: tRNA threonylcarbamoyladenosine dehydratase [Candidatus Avacholeplasma faecigallinarum]|nr:tRNA threonylcarbamoyladenosine dehydratase [Candidatus Avacholeplasma faecigallinarum]
MQQRMIPLLTSQGLKKLNQSHVCVFGIGGVGGFVVEALARSCVKYITIVDFDIINESNLNRQIIALHSTLGRKKVDVMKERILDINKDCIVEALDLFVNEESIKKIDFSQFDYVIDCVDNVTAKINIIQTAKNQNIKIISSMGTGNKLNPLLFQIKDISKTTVCPLARVMRYELKKRGIKDVKVLFSTEEPIKSPDFIASVAFVPSVAGLLIAREVILDLTINDTM